MLGMGSLLPTGESRWSFATGAVSRFVQQLNLGQIAVPTSSVDYGPLFVQQASLQQIAVPTSSVDYCLLSWVSW